MPQAWPSWNVNDWYSVKYGTNSKDSRMHQGPPGLTIFISRLLHMSVLGIGFSTDDLDCTMTAHAGSRQLECEQFGTSRRSQCQSDHSARVRSCTWQVLSDASRWGGSWVWAQTGTIRSTKGCLRGEPKRRRGYTWLHCCSVIREVNKSTARDMTWCKIGSLRWQGKNLGQKWITLIIVYRTDLRRQASVSIAVLQCTRTLIPEAWWHFKYIRCVC